MYKNFLTLLSLVLGMNAWAHWDLNDVSYLLPLPKKAYQNSYLHMGSVGVGGELLDKKWLEKLPNVYDHSSKEEVRQISRVLSVRIDPCSPVECKKQVRLVWQLLFPARTVPTTADVAVHTFYEMSDSEFKSMLGDIKSWKRKYRINTKGLPLQVHPALSDEETLKDFNNILLKYIGHQNISRITLMTIKGMGDIWAFFGYNIVNGVETDLFRIPRTERSSQVFFNYSRPLDFYPDGKLSPEASGQDTINYIVAQAFRDHDQDRKILINEFKASYNLENPKIYHSENADCVSCHVSNIARDWILKEGLDDTLQNIVYKYNYKNPNYNLSRSPQVNSHNLRSFGYFDSDPSISQRVINESAEVADYLNKYYR